MSTKDLKKRIKQNKEEIEELEEVMAFVDETPGCWDNEISEDMEFWTKKLLEKIKENNQISNLLRARYS